MKLRPASEVGVHQTPLPARHVDPRRVVRTDAGHDTTGPGRGRRGGRRIVGGHRHNGNVATARRVVPTGSR